jgi:RHS repeat-associated protein
MTDPLGQLTHYRYDALGRLLQITYPDRANEHYEYDPQGNLIAHTDAKGQITRYRYNGQGLPVERIDTKGQILTYRYDTALRLVELINANTETYRFTYNEESRLASETGFDGKLTTYQYDAAGQLNASESGGVRTEYHRDSLGQLLAKITPEGHNRYAYDPLGRLTAVRSPQAEQRFAYDPVGQLIEERHRYMLEPAVPPQAQQPSAAFKLRHEYDPMGNRIRSLLPNARVVDTLRYGPGHWHATHWSGHTIVDLERDSLHRETQRELGQAQERLSASRDYDPQSRLSAMTINQGRKKLRERRYQYDLEGNLTRIDDRQQGITRYAYDPLGQLLSAVKPDIKETFAFDPAGNMVDKLEKEKLKRESETEEPPTQPTGLAYVRHNRLEHFNNIDYEYDIQGNTIVKRLNPLPGLTTEAANETATLDFVYDQENRLVQVQKHYSHACITANYVYDAFGRRIAKTVSEAYWEQEDQKDQALDNAKATTTWFLWDGDNLIQEIKPDQTVTYLYEPESFVPLARIESEEGQADYHPDSIHIPPVEAWEMLEDPAKCEHHVRWWQREQAWQIEQAHQTQWQAWQQKAKQNEANDRIHYYHCDHLGTPLELYDENGHAVWSARYKSWGKIYRYEAKEIDQPLRFLGQYEDEETGLYYNRFRYYDADAGRYITQDPIGLAGGLNAYVYGPNPTGWVDPFGLAKKCPPCGEDPKRAKSNPERGRFDTEHDGPLGFDKANSAARKNAGNLGQNTQKMFDPKTGTQIGEMSADGKRGWRIDDDHLNWWDWTGGKKGQGGKYGHEFFPKNQSGPHSEHIGYAPWQ